jgi:hypothetical protein
MAKKEALAGVRRSVMEEAEFDRLPTPLREDVGRRLDAVVQHTMLMGDKPERYGIKAAKRVAALPDETNTALLKKFGLRISRTPFTISGVPSQDERQLSQDIWSALPADERQRIVENTKLMVSDDMSVGPGGLPDQTPYAVRLTHRYLQFRQEKSR